MNKHILVTEDDKNVADGLREILESDGYTVSCADCASAAMQTMRDGGADLVILDVRLGQDDGYELCRRIREFSNVPILFLTACSSEIELVRGFRAGGDDYVAKPLSSAAPHIKKRQRSPENGRTQLRQRKLPHQAKRERA